VLWPVPELLRSVIVFRSLERSLNMSISISNSTRFEEWSSSKPAEHFQFQLFQQLFRYLRLQRGMIRATLAQVPYLIANDSHKTKRQQNHIRGEIAHIRHMTPNHDTKLQAHDMYGLK
jgi:hypothetical protein